MENTKTHTHPFLKNNKAGTVQVRWDPDTRCFILEISVSRKMDPPETAPSQYRFHCADLGDVLGYLIQLGIRVPRDLVHGLTRDMIAFLQQLRVIARATPVTPFVITDGGIKFT